jgi:hypothetical protein
MNAAKEIKDIKQSYYLSQAFDFLALTRVIRALRLNWFVRLLQESQIGTILSPLTLGLIM